jgi:ribosome-binding factor A
MRTSSRLKVFVLAGALVALAVPVRAADVDKYLPNDTEIVLVVNVKQFTEAPLVKKHGLSQFREHLKSNEQVAKILEAFGFDPLKDLTSVTIAINGISQNSKGLLIAHGQFDVAKIEAKSEELAKEKSDILKIHKEGTTKLYEVTAPQNDKPLIVALVDNSTVVASPDKEEVMDAVAKAAGSKKSEISKSLRALIEKQDAAQTFWGVIPGEAIGKNEIAAADEKTKKITEKIENVFLGFTVSKDVKLSIIVATKSADNAKELAEEVKEGLNQAKGFLALMAGNEKKLAPVVDLVGSIKVTTEGSNLLLKSEVSEELLEKGLKDN